MTAAETADISARRGPRRGAEAMNRQRIIDEARALVESGEEFSMRRLAADLGVAPTTIYWHVGDRDAVLDALIDDVARESADIAPTGRSAAARIASIARQMRHQVRAHPALIQLANQRGRGPAVSFPSQVVLVRELNAAGVVGVEAARAAWSILHLVGGTILLEGVLDEHRSAGGSSAALWAEFTDDSVDPRTARKMATPGSPDEVFEYQLDLLLRGLLGAE
jgi:AcrR family transcriptional regulator